MSQESERIADLLWRASCDVHTIRTAVLHYNWKAAEDFLEESIAQLTKILTAIKER